MRQYVYAFRCEAEDGEVFFRFPRFPEIISAVGQAAFAALDKDQVAEYGRDAVVTALESVIAAREDVPEGDDPALVPADGFVRLSVGESMKLELYKLYRANCRSSGEFARLLGKPETAARRLLDLRHASKASEIEKAVAALGKRLVHNWSLEAA